MTLVDPGLWCEIGPGSFAGRAALFLDRDDVVVVDTHYLGRADDVRMIDGAASAVARCNAANIPVVLVTNQSGVARGYYDWNAFQTVQRVMLDALRNEGAHLDAVLACAYHADGRAPLQVRDHPWRKPNPGMLLEAASRMKLDLRRSWIAGDKAADLAAGRAAAISGGTLITVDERERQAALKLADAGFVVETAANLADAIGRVIGRLAA